MPTPQQRASSVSFPIPTLHVAPLPSKHCHTYMAHELHGSDRHVLCGLRENFDPAHDGATRSVQRRPCGTLRKVMARAITKRISWHLAPTMRVELEHELTMWARVAPGAHLVSGTSWQAGGPGAFRVWQLDAVIVVATPMYPVLAMPPHLFLYSICLVERDQADDK